MGAALLPLALALAALDAGAVDLDLTAEAIVTRTNAFREAQGLDALRDNPALAQAAERFARYMSDTGRYGHAADGSDAAARAADRGYENCMVAENIATQYRTDDFASAVDLAGAFVQAWEGSPEHRRHMTQPAVTDIGVGVARGADGRYFAVQLLGRPESASVRFDVYNRAHHAIEYQAGGRSYSLAPREARTHVACAPTELTLPYAAEAAPFVVRAENGAQYTVLDDRIVARHGGPPATARR